MRALKIFHAADNVFIASVQFFLHARNGKFACCRYVIMGLKLTNQPELGSKRPQIAAPVLDVRRRTDRPWM